VYSHNTDVEFDSIVRLWIPVEDCKMGHALFVEDEVLYNFKAGEVYTFDNHDLCRCQMVRILCQRLHGAKYKDITVDAILKNIENLK